MKNAVLLLCLAATFTACNCKNTFVINSYREDEPDELVSVVVLYRHGDRSPITSYPTDPYIDISYWPDGYGQLLNKGKDRQYSLGQWLRKRYSKFLPDEYSPNDILVVSTDADRTLMSAAANLAGLYPPPESEVWNDDLLWEPIPIHTKPETEDDILAMDKECPMYTVLTRDPNVTEFAKNLSVTHADFFEFVNNHTGRNTTTLDDIENLYSVFYVYQNHNSSFIPSWADSLDKELFKYLAGVHLALRTFTTEMARLKVGPFFNYLISYFDEIIRNETDTPPKFLMLSAHDGTISAILNAMGAFDYSPPEFAATVLWELRKNSNGAHYVNLLYKRNSTDIVEKLVVNECDRNCAFNDFKTNLFPITVSPTSWEMECKVYHNNAKRYSAGWVFLFVMVLFSMLRI